MAEYVIGTESEIRYRVAKFEGGKTPSDIYTVGVYSGYKTCSCPAGRYDYCKHRKMVEAYMEYGHPILNCFWTDGGGKIYAYYESVTAAWRKELEKVAVDVRKGRKKK